MKKKNNPLIVSKKAQKHCLVFSVNKLDELSKSLSRLYFNFFYER